MGYILFGSKALGMMTLALFVSCAPPSGLSGDGSAQSQSSNIVANYPAKGSNLRISLIDAPKEELKEVHVNIAHVELLLEKGGKHGRVLVAKDLGDIDLLTLQNGNSLILSDLNIPEGVAVKQIRLLLNNTDNYVIRQNGERVEMQTPSGQQSGVKILLKTPVVFDSNFSYAMTIDFDAKKSVVHKGNGGFLLKPVIKLPHFSKVPSDRVDDDGGEVPPPSDEEEPVTDGSDENDQSEGDGGEDGSGGEDGGSGDGGSGDDETDIPPEVDPDTLDSFFNA